MLTNSPDASETYQPLRIRVAEDNHVNQVVLRAMLSKTGHKLDMVGNGAEAISAVMRVPYDLVLMDVQMPKIDGITATRKIRVLPGEVSNIDLPPRLVPLASLDRSRCLASGDWP